MSPKKAKPKRKPGGRGRDMVFACGERVAVTIGSGAKLPASYRKVMEELGPGTLDDFVTILPPAHLQRYRERIGAFVDRDPELAETVAGIAEAVIFAEDTDGRTIVWNPPTGAGGEPRVFALRAFDAVEVGRDVADWLAREMKRDDDRARHWFRPYRRHTIAIAETTSGQRGDAAALDRWVANLAEQQEAELLAATENKQHGWGRREIHLPAHDGVLAVQTVPVLRASRSTLRFTLPLGADARAVAKAVLSALPDELSRWRKLATALDCHTVGSSLT